MAFSFQCAAITHIGNRRKNNEDNFFIGDGTILSLVEQQSMSQLENRVIRKQTSLDGAITRIYAVSDGMGGHKDGEIASRIVVEALASFSRRHTARACATRRDKFEFIQSFQEMVSQTNGELLAQHEELRSDGMGATLSGVLFFADESVAFNIGDSSTFLYEDGSVQKLTVNDNEAERFRNTDAASLPMAGRRLTKYFGIPRTCGVLTARISAPITLRSGQIYLMASDGLTDCLSACELTEVIRLSDGLSDHLSAQLVERALNRENGGHDNITVLVVKVIQN